MVSNSLKNPGILWLWKSGNPDSSPPARFYGLPKLHKANCPMCPIVSACGTSTYNLAKYLTKILKVYVGHSSSFVKDSKDLMDKLQSIKLQDNEELVSFDVSALFTSIPVNQALDVINQLIIQHQTDMDFKYKVGKAWYEVADHLDREDVMALLKVVLNNCVFSFQGKFYKQLHGAAMGSPCSPVVANIYMEYFEKRALGPELPVSFTINTWLRYVDDVLTIVKKGTRDSLLNYLNSIDPNIKFTIEPQTSKGLFLSWTHFQDHLATKLSLQFTENLPIWIGIWISTLIIQNQPNVQLLEL